MKQINLNEKALKILERAESGSDEKAYLFLTTFERYQTQLKNLQDLKKEIGAEGMTVQKEYVKGRKNVYINPAVREYNQTSTAANQTVQTLLKIINSFEDESSQRNLLEEFYYSDDDDD